jgi:hypothetical protein
MSAVDTPPPEFHEASVLTNRSGVQAASRMQDSSPGQQFDRIIPGHPALDKVGDAVGPREELYEPGKRELSVVSKCRGQH